MKFARFKMTAVAATALTAAVVGAAVSATPAQAASGPKRHGCPYGAVCIYPGASFNNDHPSLFFYSYGPHNLSNQKGYHRFLNNQYGGASAYLCSGSNGTGKDLGGVDDQGGYFTPNLTPAYSVVLDRSGKFPTSC